MASTVTEASRVGSCKMMIPAKIVEIRIIGNTTIPSVKIVLAELIDSSLEKLYGNFSLNY